MTRAAELAGHQISLKTALIEFTDGDDAIAIADAGVVTLLTTAVAKSEGGAVTTNITQGVSKAWTNFKGADTFTVNDSFNVASMTDNGTGDHSMAITNDMSSANYSFTSGGINLFNNYFAWGAISADSAKLSTAAVVRFMIGKQNGGHEDVLISSGTVHGDLA